MIPDDFIQTLLSRTDIADVVGQYVQLRKGGANLLGLCPFHKEKSPSFTVSPTKQFYHCFGCGAHGSAITFLMEHTGASFPQAVQTLSHRLGLSVPESPRSANQREQWAQRRDERKVHTQALELAHEFYKKQLRTSEDAINYLKGRGVTGAIAARFGLGWVPDDRRALSRVATNYDEAVWVEAGLVVEREDGTRYDRFRGRVMFPIHNQKGELIGFGGRLIAKGEPKYLNSPETILFSKGHELYGLWEGRQAISREREAIVVEGYMDVVGLAQQGVENVVATLGTATTPDHLRKLVRLTDRIVFSFDGDAAGRKAAWRALQAALPILRDDLSVRFLFLPDGQDPDSYVRSFGQAAFKASVNESLALSTFFLQELSSRHRMEEPEGRSACLHEAAPLIAQIAPGAFKSQLLHALAYEVKLTQQELEASLQATQVRIVKTMAAPAGAHATQNGSQLQSGGGRFGGEPRFPDRRKSNRFERLHHRSVTPMARRLLLLLLTHPDLAQSVGEQQLETLDKGPHLSLVHDFIVLVQSNSATHLGALLESADPDSELAEVLQRLSADLMTGVELPDPQQEWDDALRRIELESLRMEQAGLIESGLQSDDARQRYMELSQRIRSLS
ncbi:DNA primase [Orrella sp. 11846]|uniref:DNA primase n=1 Tax=Orrella sp. 11846 TaxID=3409913 RepID=UPI003B5C2BB7